VSVIGSDAALGGTFRFARNTTLELTQDAAYSPSYLYQLFPSIAVPEVGESIAAAPDYRADDTRSYGLNSRAKLAAGSPRQNRVELRAERSTTDFTGVRLRPDLNILAAAGKWAHGIGRTASVSTEYEYREGEFGFGGRATEQRLRIGGEWTPALSRTRRAVFRLSLAPSVLEIPESATNTLVIGTLFKLEGDASVEYPFLRTWSAGGTYQRGVEYIAVLSEPVFRDAVRLEACGLVGKRTDVSASAASSVGASALNQNSQRFDSYTGTVRTRYTFSRSLSVYGEYLYYYYRFHDLSGLATGLPGRFEQHGLRAGLMLWARPVGR
jgi:hypothetical protein